MSEHTGTLRVTIREAAERLGVTEGAVRKRVQRGSLPKEQGKDGRVYVYLPVSHDASRESRTEPPRLGSDPRDELIEQLRGEVEAWREESRRKDHIIAGLVERLPPALEAPESPTEAAGGSSDTGRGGVAPEREAPISRPWWRRMFGG